MTTVVTTIATVTATEGDRTTVVIVTAMTNTEQTIIMIGTKRTFMTNTTRGIHVMIGRNLIEGVATIKGVRTNIVGTLLKTNCAALMWHWPPHLHKRLGTTHTLPHTLIVVTPVIWQQLPALSVTNPATTLPNAQPRTAARPRS